MRINLLKTIGLILFALFTANIQAQTDNKISPENDVHKKEGKTPGIKQDDGMLYGKDQIKKDNTIEISEVAANPEKYKGQEITLKGTVGDVCQNAGCWMVLTDGKNDIRIFTNHDFFLPTNCFDKNVILSGKFDVADVSEEDARHYAEESDRARTKSIDIIGVQKWMVIDASGIKILDSKDGNGGGENSKPKKQKSKKKCRKDCCKK
ncbi:hypothetical protein BH10BAC5_BH10BAC5_05640 [soil metagenome]